MNAYCASHPHCEESDDHEIVILVGDQFSLMDFTCCVEVFGISNNFGGHYHVIYASQNGGGVRSNNGLTLSTTDIHNIRPSAGETVVIIGGGETSGELRKRVKGWLRGQCDQCRLCAVGAGVDLLPVGPQDGRESSDAPAPVASRQGSAWTCAGKSTALDLMLKLVAEDFGRPLALQVAEALYLYVWRQANEPAISAALELQKLGNSRFAALHDYIRHNLAADLRVEVLAEWIGMSPRTFARLYRQETGMTPAAAVTNIRLEAARRLIDGNSMSLARIADLTGFGTELTLRRAHQQAFGHPPSAARK